MPIFIVSTDVQEANAKDIAEAKIVDKEVVIGRNFLIFECTDTRVSRSHGILVLEDPNADFVTIKSTHTNPIFYKLCDKDEVHPLVTEEVITLRHDDQFGLLSDKYWYKVSVRSEQENREKNIRPEGFLRIRAPAELNNSQNFPEILPQVTNGCPPICDSQQSISTSPDPIASSSQVPDLLQSELVESSNVKREADSPTDDGSPKRLRLEDTTNNNCTPTTSESNDQPSTSSSDQNMPRVVVKKEEPDSSTLRDSCPHGVRCYRQNKEHRAEFAHPNDSDYRRPNFPPAPPGSPNCPYGTACYRRNPMHFVQFSHPPSSLYTTSTVNNDNTTNPNAPAWLPRPLRQQKREPANHDSDEESDEMDEDFSGSSSDEYQLLNEDSNSNGSSDSAIFDDGARNED